MAGLTPVNGMTLVRLAIALACIVLPAATAVAQDPQPPTLLSVTADAGLVTLRWTLPSDLRTIYRI